MKNSINIKLLFFSNKVVINATYPWQNYRALLNTTTVCKLIPKKSNLPTKSSVFAAFPHNLNQSIYKPLSSVSKDLPKLRPLDHCASTAEKSQKNRSPEAPIFLNPNRRSDSSIESSRVEHLSTDLQLPATYLRARQFQHRSVRL